MWVLCKKVLIAFHYLLNLVMFKKIFSSKNSDAKTFFVLAMGVVFSVSDFLLLQAVEKIIIAIIRIFFIGYLFIGKII